MRSVFTRCLHWKAFLTEISLFSFRTWKELCPRVLWRGSQVLRSHGEHVGGAGLQTNAWMAALGLRLLQLQMPQRTHPHPGGQLHVRVLLPGAGDQHTNLLGRLAAQGRIKMSTVPGCVWRGVPRSRWTLSRERGSASAEHVPQGRVGLRCHFEFPSHGCSSRAVAGPIHADCHELVAPGNADRVICWVGNRIESFQAIVIQEIIQSAWGKVYYRVTKTEFIR